MKMKKKLLAVCCTCNHSDDLDKFPEHYDSEVGMQCPTCTECGSTCVDVIDPEHVEVE